MLRNLAASSFCYKKVIYLVDNQSFSETSFKVISPFNFFLSKQQPQMAPLVHMIFLLSQLTVVSKRLSSLSVWDRAEKIAMLPETK